MSRFGSIIQSVVQWVMSLFGYHRDPTIGDIAASNAVAQTEVVQEENGNAELRQATEARTAADTQLLHGDNGEADAINTDRSAPVNTSPDAHFRD